eukprot:CAMPEP_0182428374 /NCGR_PEP_ID=MMETSP1167-20130531/22658_1 /TAXON_ID=2988 /ORGANISM="Mallomonas Sp, Strain CCMP3275" /LENGTH=509 /DNA_ID=CAMNT_0024611247 /DNA_START=380 /DNA_END=1909 /DNA_ORIENTATION=+
MNLEAAVDFDVLVLLAAIMAINFIIVHQKETKTLIDYVQTQVQQTPKKGFWLVSFAAFIVSPFLTNDGVCLLFVEPILNAFESLNRAEDTSIKAVIEEGESTHMKLEKGDAFFFLISLACSSNIGSSLTYTGNPQNMIVAEDSISVLPAYLFLLYMVVPAISSWIITISWVQRCWLKSRSAPRPSFFTKSGAYPELLNSCLQDESADRTKGNGDIEKAVDSSSALVPATKNPMINSASGKEDKNQSQIGNGMEWQPKHEESMIKKVQRVVVSPFPYAMLILMGGMIVLIFVEIMSIAGLVCVTAVVMVVVLVLGNHWRGLPILGTDGVQAPLTAEEKIANTNEFFEELFDSIDYSLLMIFLGTFVVVENVDSTGLPRMVWNKIVGATPFNTYTSVIGISLFVLITSQLLGNVAVIQLAKPNVVELGDAEKKYAWAVISFVATVGGNLTITGSAANIIVAEKVRRLDPRSSIDFFRHYHVCFWITLACCMLGGVIITGIVMADAGLDETW